MKFKKLIFAFFLFIPLAGYCGFIDWITGYQEVKAKIEQGLEKKYHGEKFKVLDVEWSSNLGGYNFRYEPIKSEDGDYGGSYYPDTGVLAANGYMWSRVGRQWRDIVKPQIAKLSSDYFLIGGMGSRSPRNHREIEKKGGDDPSVLALGDLFGDAMSAQDWIKKDHNYIAGNIEIYINMPKNAESVYKLLKLIKNINDEYQKMQLNEYSIRLNVFKFPKGFEGLQKYWDYHSKHVYHSSSAFATDYNLQKYIWLKTWIDGCSWTNTVLKDCDAFTLNKAGNKLDLAAIKKASQKEGSSSYKTIVEGSLNSTLGNRLYNLDDIAKQFRYYPKTSYKEYSNGQRFLKKNISISIMQSPYWSQVQNLINQGDN